ncbi:MAG: peroxiredoxin [Methanobacteriota archaeon]|nr:MAG: peroxiredoxin [Euryarchaeota archaeon]
MKLKKGDVAPNFKIPDEKRELHQIPGKKIVFFFPKAFTPGCTKEACSIQDTHSDLQMHGIETIIGISMDDEKTLQKFKERYNLTYSLVSDKSGEISKAYGVFKNFLLAKMSDRTTFIIGDDNKILEVLELGIRGGKSAKGLDHHGEEILNLLEDLH